MLNFFVAYDDIDPELGDYLLACFQDIEAFLLNILNTNVSIISGKQCTEDEIQIHTNNFNGSRFIFLGYTHGSVDALTALKVPFVNSANAVKFKNSFFYTCACLSAIKLGPELEKNGCLAYIGYSKEVNMVFRLATRFIKCKNSGIKFFLQGDKTLGQVYQHMKEVYQMEVDFLANQSFDDFVIAALLQSNMDALVCLGNKELTLSDFVLNE